MMGKKQRMNCDRRGGFTLIEVMFAAGVGTLVLAATMTTFIWCIEQYTNASKTAWSQNEAMRSSDKILWYIRNATAISAIDESGGTWVQLRFPNNSITTLGYTNASGLLRGGSLFLTRSNLTTVLVAQGVTAYMDPNGFTPFIFTQVNTNTLTIAYRVSKPNMTNDASSANDNDYAAYVKFSGCLRNGVNP